MFAYLELWRRSLRILWSSVREGLRKHGHLCPKWKDAKQVGWGLAFSAFPWQSSTIWRSGTRNSNVAKTIWGTEQASDSDLEVGRTLVWGKGFFLERKRIKGGIIRAYIIMNSTEEMHQEVTFSILQHKDVKLCMKGKIKLCYKVILVIFFRVCN